ncbi:sulfatase-like hydrolase/transferase [Halogeometricum limi]|uniref:Sulfatase n=1 Tax=Halogeometricum limi TaxID=555875 RepID=A0A1I6IJX3_9EURY|nr:sulfatase-like hydrolase/transferase [Halogeometricum limi]SFR67025.1 Sulfatase [Halogeometricum limi]
MSLLHRLPQGLDRARKYYSNEDAVTATKRVTYDVQAEAVRLLFDHFQEDYGTPIYERDWDVLIILDACRADLMNEVADDYPFLEKYETYNSIGSNSAEWLKKNFVDEYADEMKKTAMVSGNPHTDVYLDEDDFAVLDEVWRYAWEKEDELFRANYITDRAISVMREHQPERMIVHYMQPHHPFIPYFEGFETELHGKWLNQWRDVRIGLASKSEKWRQYRDNLHYVLEYVDLLLHSIDSDSVVISSDHGEAIGEWGIYGHYDVPLQVLREVPWIETVAEDNGEYVPEFTPEHTDSEGARHDVEDQLEKLGYL